MKRLIYTLFILLTLCYSCDSFLDVRPTGEIVNNELFETAEGFEEAIYGVYSYLAREPLYGKNMTYGLVDVVGQYFSGGWDQHWSNQLRIYNYKHMEVRPEIDAIWESMYKGISYVNNMLENLAKHDSTKFALYNVYKAEGLGLRAFMHFELLRLFSESIIQNNLKQICKNRTVIIIAHRLSTLKDADAIMVVEKGSIAEYGTIQNLIDKKGIYYHLLLQQQMNR